MTNPLTLRMSNHETGNAHPCAPANALRCHGRGGGVRDKWQPVPFGRVPCFQPPPVPRHAAPAPDPRFAELVVVTRLENVTLQMAAPANITRPTSPRPTPDDRHKIFVLGLVCLGCFVVIVLGVFMPMSSQQRHMQEAQVHIDQIAPPDPCRCTLSPGQVCTPYRAGWLPRGIWLRGKCN